MKCETIPSVNGKHGCPEQPAAVATRHCLPTGRRWYPPIKRAIDIVLAAALLVATAPLLVFAMLLVKLTSRGPALYSQTRVGRQGKCFTIFKIRSMFHGCEAASGACWCVPGDRRVTRIGWVLRKTHIDELPQLWNVLVGHMSLVGPRPERPEFLPELEQALPYYRDRLLILPGLSGLAQVQLPPDTDIESVRRKLAYDLYYIRHLSPGLDLRIMLGTLGYLLRVPFWLSHKLLQIPTGQAVEWSYHQLASRIEAPVRPLVTGLKSA